MNKLVFGVLAFLALALVSCSDTNAKVDRSNDPTADAKGNVVLSSDPPATIVIQPTVIRLPSATPVPPTVVVVTNRQNCNQIRGTAYQSDTERDWFLANCVAAQPTSPPSIPQQPANPQRNCAPWPSQVSQMMARLPTPTGLCLIKDASTGGCQGSGTCYNPPAREVRYVRSDGLSELHHITHEICHAHQHQSILNAGLPPVFPSSWYQTPEGQSFMATVSGEPWNNGWNPPNAYEDFAETCVAWYGTGSVSLASMPKRAAWVQQWLPK